MTHYPKYDEEELQRRARVRRRLARQYASVQGLLAQKTWTHCQIAGGNDDFYEALSDVNLQFILSDATFDPNKGKYTTHQGRAAFYVLLERRCKHNERMQQQPTPDVDLSLIADKAPSFDPERFAGELSDAAARMVEIALQAADDKASPATLRQWLVNYFCDLGWSAKETLKAFMEIREALR